MKYNNNEKNLKLLQEECAEVIQIISKCLRFGMHDVNPKDTCKWSNKMRLEQEIGHVMAFMQILIDNGLIQQEGVLSGADHKFRKLKKHYNSNYNKKLWEQPDA